MDIELIENAVIDKLIYVVKGYHKKNDKHGYGTEHIKFRHLDNPNKRGYIKLDELVNLGNSLRAYIKQFEKPFVDKNNAKIYEWQDDDKTRFRLVVDKKRIKINKKTSMNPRHTSIAQAHTLTNQGTNATSIANVIISFYSDRNLKRKMKFKNPQVENFYKSLLVRRGIEPTHTEPNDSTLPSETSLTNSKTNSTTKELENQVQELTQITIDTADIAPQTTAALIGEYEKLGENGLAHKLIDTISANDKVMQGVQQEFTNLVQQESEQPTQSVDLTQSQGVDDNTQTPLSDNNKPPKNRQ